MNTATFRNRCCFLALVAAAGVLASSTRAHAQSAPVPADARVDVHLDHVGSSYQFTLSSDRGSATCEGPCAIPVLAGPHNFVFEGSHPLRRAIEVPRGFSRIDVHGPDEGRHTTGVGLVVGGGAAFTLGVVLFALVGASSSSSALPLAVLLIGVPSSAIATALVVPGAILMGTSGPRVDFEPVRADRMAEGPAPITAGWTLRF